MRITTISDLHHAVGDLETAMTDACGRDAFTQDQAEAMVARIRACTVICQVMTQRKLAADAAKARPLPELTADAIEGMDDMLQHSRRAA
jgi:hypothetical protein